jgi:hypothetical protein
LRADIALIATAGDRQRMPEFLDLGEKAKLFSEEKALLKKARQALTQR